ncbi:ABC transporter substrate-binding protein [Oceaniglobus trochenteri]|uniref:ABC transporter substrate-binding protein n=1 Tax=Oceaniglobus trochenteri TaxID=2763260 RepID=UPI001CFFC265|nr:ABC transporter substrate-binding protein [Oceaniglobus trochenteri]
MRTTATTALCATLALLTGAPAMAQEVDVIHWLVSPGEVRAMSVLSDAFNAAGGVYVDAAVAGGGAAARQMVMNRIAASDTPGAWYGQPGVPMTAFAERDILAPLDQAAAEQNWDEVMYDTFVTYGKYDGHYYAIPLGIHAQNWMWSSRAVLDAAGVEVPATWAEFLEIAPKIEEAGFIPLALGGQSWQENLVFKSALLEVGGADFYRAVYVNRDAEAAGSDTMAQAFALFRSLKPHTNQGVGRSWNDTLSLVQTGKAAFQIMGDWAKGEFIASGQEPGVDYECTLAPGTAGLYNVAIDVLLPGNTGDDETLAAQNLLASSITTPETQLAFSQNKGSIPVRKDVDVSSLDACAQLAVETLAQEGSEIPVDDLVLTPEYRGQIIDLLSEFWNGESMSPEEAAERFGAIIADIED